MPQLPKKSSSAVSSRGSASKPKTKSKSARPAPQRNPSLPPPSVEQRQWVIAQLSAIGEREKNLPLITRSARQILRQPTLEVFIPAISQEVRGESEVTFFMDGYVFIQHVADVQYLRLQDTTYFSSVLCRTVTLNGRKCQQYSLLDDKSLEPMRKGVQKLKIAAFKTGDAVKVIRGAYKNLPGVIAVVYEDGQTVQVMVELLRSKKVLLDYPVTYLVRVSSV
jgi:transcription antitermination factor NusG